MSRLLDDARALSAEFGDAFRLSLRESTGLRREVEPSGGASQGVWAEATARIVHTTPGGSTEVAGPIDDREGLHALFRRAALDVKAPSAGRRIATAAPMVKCESPVFLDGERARELGAALLRSVSPGTCVQSLLVRQDHAQWSFFQGADERHDTETQEQLLIRVEGREGAIVDGLRAPHALGITEVPALAQRLAHALSRVRERNGAPSEDLPWLLRPSVSAILLSGIAWMLGGDVAAAAPALLRARGKRAFPKGLTLVDRSADAARTQDAIETPPAASRAHLEPRPLARLARLRELDDEGSVANELVLLRDGVLEAFLHSRASAAAMNEAPNGRGFFDEQGRVRPSPLNLSVEPFGRVEPDERVELDARVETFTTMPKPGQISLIVAGCEYRGGQTRDIGPFEWQTSVSSALQRVCATGCDPSWRPTAESVSAPSVLLSPRSR